MTKRESVIKKRDPTRSVSSNTWHNIRSFLRPPLTWPLIFRRLRQDGSRGDPPTEPAAASPPATQREEKRSSSKLPERQQKSPGQSIRAKVNLILKDLSLDTPAVNIVAVVGGKKQSNRQRGSAPVAQAGLAAKKQTNEGQREKLLTPRHLPKC